MCSASGSSYYSSLDVGRNLLFSSRSLFKNYGPPVLSPGSFILHLQIDLKVVPSAFAPDSHDLIGLTKN
ncbi:uncharacterized protein ARMOST_04286 [Armillaria ostoyae]|uniref:Uncharacterized protein n=1 Tax=Armillaria ostoyae TaxID=47428 RepID=A0A284QX21_ARMOS|nr:uncharacterized protein ARMOST_04286 [Armillaria ostoyae]